MGQIRNKQKHGQGNKQDIQASLFIVTDIYTRAAIVITKKKAVVVRYMLMETCILVLFTKIKNMGKEPSTGLVTVKAMPLKISTKR